MKTSRFLTSGRPLSFPGVKESLCNDSAAFQPFRPAFRLFALLSFALSAISASALVLQWDKNQEPDVAGYKVYYGLASTTPLVVDRGTNTTCTFSTLSSGQTYSFYVTAYNTAGLESSPSTPISYTVPQTNAASPIISNIADLSTPQDTATPSIAFLVNDPDTPAANLTLLAASSNPILVPVANIIFGGSGTNRTVKIAPASGKTGTCTITVTVSDGVRTASDFFVLTVTPSSSGTTSATFANNTAITIPDKGAATPYPAAINVSGLAGTISNLTVTLRNLSHKRTRDLDILLVAPTGQKVLLLSDAGGNVANNVTLTLSDAASSAVSKSKISSGTFRLANYSDSSTGGDNFASPAPAGPYASALSAFNNLSPNGTWSLYVMDDNSGYKGSLAGGWTLTISTKSDGTFSATSLLADASSNDSSIPEAPSQLRLSIDNDGDNIVLQANGTPGQRYLIESSEDLASWQQTPIAADNQGAIRFNAEKNGKQFYRLSEAP